MSNTTFDTKATAILETASELIQDALEARMGGKYFGDEIEPHLKVALDSLAQLHQQETLKKEKEAFKAGVAMSGGDLSFQKAFYKQWCTNLNNTKKEK